MPSSSQRLLVNHAPVLTLWAAVVAKRLGVERDEALTLARAFAGLNAYAEGKALGIFHPKPAEVKAKRKTLKHGEGLTVNLLHGAVPAVRTPMASEPCPSAVQSPRTPCSDTWKGNLAKGFGRQGGNGSPRSIAPCSSDSGPRLRPIRGVSTGAARRHQGMGRQRDARPEEDSGASNPKLGHTRKVQAAPKPRTLVVGSIRPPG